LTPFDQALQVVTALLLHSELLVALYAVRRGGTRAAISHGFVLGDFALQRGAEIAAAHHTVRVSVYAQTHATPKQSI
jgi:hypothetical protein